MAQLIKSEVGGRDRSEAETPNREIDFGFGSCRACVRACVRAGEARRGEAKLRAGIGYEARAKSSPEFRGGVMSNPCPCRECAGYLPGVCWGLHSVFRH